MYIYKLPSGRWRVLVKHDGQRRSASATTRGEVQRLGAEMIIELGGRPSESPTVRELLEGHLAVVQLSPTTRADYERVRDRLPAAFLDRIVADVGPIIIEQLYAQLLRDGYSAHRVGRVHDLLSVAWRRAERNGWANRNPVRVVSAPAFEEHEIVPPTPQQVAKLIACASADFQPFVRLAASTGARRGELVALQWGDVDLAAGQVIIRRSVVYTPKSGVVERGTKTGRKGHRTIAVGGKVAEALKAIHQTQTGRAAAGGLGAPRWVFSFNAGTDHWFPEYPTTAFEAARKAAGLPDVRLHDLRHFVATQMLARGYSVAQVAARLGQTQAATTHRYSHWIPSKDRDAAEELEDLNE